MMETSGALIPKAPESSLPPFSYQNCFRELPFAIAEQKETHKIELISHTVSDSLPW